MRKRITALALALLMVLSLTACGECKHETWTPASCTTPATCSECAITEGEALGHSWQEASCSAPETCYICGETQGEALPHSFGAWALGESDMSRSCTVCGESETQAIDYDVAVKSMLQGNWDFHYSEASGQFVSCYSGAGGYARFTDDQGNGMLYFPTYQNGVIVEMLEVPLTVTQVEYYPENNAYDFYLVADDGSSFIGQLYIGSDGSMSLTVLIMQDTSITMTKNNREAKSLSGIWTTAEDGELYTLELSEDGSLSGTLEGTWHPMAVINSNGMWYTGFNIIYKDGDVRRSGSGQIFVCYDTQDVWEALEMGYGSNISIYMDEDWVNLDQVSEEMYAKIEAAHESGADKIVNTWSANSVSVYDTNSGSTVEEAGDFSITFNADGSFTSNMPGLDDATWSYRGAKTNGGNAVYLNYNTVFNGYDNYVSIYEDGTLGLSYNTGSSYYTYDLNTAEGLEAQANAEAASDELIVGTWTGSEAQVFDINANSEGASKSGEYSLTFNEDGTVTGMLEGEYSSTWSFLEAEENDFGTMYNYKVNGSSDGIYYVVSVFEDGNSIFFSYSPDDVVYYSYNMFKS